MPVKVKTMCMFVDKMQNTWAMNALLENACTMCLLMILSALVLVQDQSCHGGH